MSCSESSISFLTDWPLAINLQRKIQLLNQSLNILPHLLSFLLQDPLCLMVVSRWAVSNDVAPLDLYCWCTWYLRATGPAQDSWAAIPNPFTQVGDNPIKSTTKGNVRKLQRHRDLFPLDFSGRLSTGEGGAGTSEHLPRNNYSILNHRLQWEKLPWCPFFWVLWRTACSMGGVYSGQVLIYSKVIFLLKLSYKQHHLLEERNKFF